MEALRSRHGGYMRALVVGGRVQDEHAEADEGVAEEDGCTEGDHYEEDVDFLAEVFAGEC
jgi:hypothetical protein